MRASAVAFFGRMNTWGGASSCGGREYLEADSMGVSFLAAGAFEVLVLAIWDVPEGSVRVKGVVEVVHCIYVNVE